MQAGDLDQNFYPYFGKYWLTHLLVLEILDKYAQPLDLPQTLLSSLFVSLLSCPLSYLHPCAADCLRCCAARCMHRRAATDYPCGHPRMPLALLTTWAVAVLRHQLLVQQRQRAPLRCYTRGASRAPPMSYATRPPHAPWCWATTSSSC